MFDTISFHEPPPGQPYIKLNALKHQKQLVLPNTSGVMLAAYKLARGQTQTESGVMQL